MRQSLEQLRSPWLVAVLALALLLAFFGRGVFSPEPQEPGGGRAPEAGRWEQAGLEALRAGDPQQAVEAFLQVPAEQLSAEGWLGLGDARLRLGETQEALAAWEQSRSLGGAAEAIDRRQLELFLDQGDYRAAGEAAQRLAGLHPDDLELQYQAGLLLLVREPESALPYLDHAGEVFPQARELRRRVLAGRRQEDRAYQLVAAGRGLAAVNEWTLAAEAFRQATQERPDYAEAWAYLGEALQHLPDGGSSPGPGSAPAEADQTPVPGLAEIEKALALDPESVAAHTIHALYWGRQGRPDLAIQALEKAIALDPENPALLSELGAAQAAKGDLQAASSAYLQAVDLAADKTPYLLLLVAFSVNHEYEVQEMALPAARRAVRLAPDDPAAVDTLGWVLFSLNDLENARRFYLRALQIDPDYAPAHLHLGQLYWREGDPNLARQELELTLALDGDGPSGTQAARLLEDFSP